MKTFSYLWQYLSEFFLEGEIFQIKVVDKIKIHILCPITFFSENRAFVRYPNVEKGDGARKTAKAIRRRVACGISKATRLQSHVRARATTRMRTRPLTHTHKDYLSHCFSMATAASWTRLNVTLHVHCLSWYYRFW